MQNLNVKRMSVCIFKLKMYTVGLFPSSLYSPLLDQSSKFNLCKDLTLRSSMDPNRSCFVLLQKICSKHPRSCTDSN